MWNSKIGISSLTVHCRRGGSAGALALATASAAASGSLSHQVVRLPQADACGIRLSASPRPEMDWMRTSVPMQPLAGARSLAQACGALLKQSTKVCPVFDEATVRACKAEDPAFGPRRLAVAPSPPGAQRVRELARAPREPLTLTESVNGLIGAVVTAGRNSANFMIHMGCSSDDPPSVAEGDAQIPHAVKILGDRGCGGVRIGSHAILTAAHCVGPGESQLPFERQCGGAPVDLTCQPMAGWVPPTDDNRVADGRDVAICTSPASLLCDGDAQATLAGGSLSGEPAESPMAVVGRHVDSGIVRALSPTEHQTVVPGDCATLTPRVIRKQKSTQDCPPRIATDDGDSGFAVHRLIATPSGGPLGPVIGIVSGRTTGGLPGFVELRCPSVQEFLVGRIRAKGLCDANPVHPGCAD